MNVFAATPSSRQLDIGLLLLRLALGSVFIVHGGQKLMMGFGATSGMLANMAGFKTHAAFGFWDGMFAEQTGKAKEAAGQFGKLTSVADLPPEKTFATLVKQAVARRDAGIKPKREKTAPKEPIAVPAAFTVALKKHQKALATFEKFSPSHRREYVEWITEAKRDETRQRRIATAIEWLSEGKPHNWKYKG